MRTFLSLSCCLVPPAVTAAPVDYNKQVLPIFKDKCLYCHSGSVTRGGLDMATHAALMKGGKRGPAVVPGDAKKSWLYLFCSGEKKPVMPPEREESPLTSREVAVIRLWIDEGAKPPAAEAAAARVALTLPPALLDPVRAVAVSPDGANVAVTRGNKIHLFDAKAGKPLRPLADPSVVTAAKKPAGVAHVSLIDALAFAPDGKQIASGGYGAIKFWDAATGKLARTVTGFADRVTCLDYAPGGKLLAAGGGAATEAGELTLLAPDGEVIKRLKEAHSDTVFGVAVSPDGKRLATCGADKMVKLWSLPGLKPLHTLEGHSHHVLGVGWSPDGKRVASGGADDAVKIWDAAKGEQVKSTAAGSGQVTRLAFVGKTPLFVTAGATRLRMWNVGNGGRARDFGGTRDYLHAVACGGQVIAAGGEQGDVWLFDSRNGRPLKTLKPGG